MTLRTTDVVIVGGGIIGCSIAYELTRAGLAVAVVEKGQVAAEASSASAGLLVPTSDLARDTPQTLELYRASLRRFVQIVPELEHETGINTEYQRSGVLRVALSEDEAATMSAQYQRWQGDFDMELSWLDRAALHQLEPELSSAISGAIFTPEEGAINGGRLTLALARAAAGQKGQFLEGCLATGVRCAEKRFVALQTHDGEIAANHLVIAAGAWSRALCEQLGLAIPIAPARGQMVAIRTIRRLLQHPVLSGKGGISPKADGTIFVGATVDLAGFDKRLRPADSTHLLETAASILPELRQGHIDRSWAGLRPYCEDGLPVIGMLPNWENVAVAAGHFQLGITGSAITGQVIKDLIIQGRSEQAIEPFSPARFTNKEQR